MNSLFTLFAVGGAVLIAIFTLTWLLQLTTKNASIIDAVWSASFPVLAMIYFALAHGYAPRQWLVLGVVCFWGFRLALYLFFRSWGHEEDVRYTALREEWGDRQHVRMLIFYYVQAVAALILSVPFALVMVNTTPDITLWEWLGAGISFIAMIGESVADNQLRTFKQDPANRGKICQQGLWFYSRHPNYFFEWLVWVGFFVMALGSAYGIISVICPLVMYNLLTKRTGIGYTEKSMLKSRGEAYAEYQRTTSAFFILPKKRG